MPSHGFFRVGAASPRVFVGNPAANAHELVLTTHRAVESGIQLLVTPELSLTGYTCKDLFHQTALRHAAIDALEYFLDETRHVDLLTLIGMPLLADGKLFNCGLFTRGGRVLGIVPKSHLPNYREFEETRWFTPASDLRIATIELLGRCCPIGTDIVTRILGTTDDPFTIDIDICEDGWMPIPPSSRRGAVITANLSASNGLVGKAKYRRDLMNAQSAHNFAAAVYASCNSGGVVYDDAGKPIVFGESTADVVFDGHSIIAENGNALAESERYPKDRTLIFHDIDIEKLQRERLITGSYAHAMAMEQIPLREIVCALEPLDVTERFERFVDPYPFVPSNPATLDENCQEVFTSQTVALARRLPGACGATKSVSIGISGGPDSTLALLVTCDTFDRLGWDRKGIIAVTMPGFGTSDATYDVAVELMKALGVTMREISIVNATLGHLKDIGHEPDMECLTCENAQARIRTLMLMDLGFVIGTGDLSEAALGWCTFNGDHMSMYNPDTGVPKTLVRHLLAWRANRSPETLKEIVLRGLAIPSSPELKKSKQVTEDFVGPYNLNDFYLFYLQRNGFRPAKIAFLCEKAWGGTYDRLTILKWMRNFYRRFFAAQFKRDSMPNGPKVGSVSLSQRGDCRLASDITAALFLAEIDELIEAAMAAQ